MVTQPKDLHRVAGFIEWYPLRDSAVVPDWLNAARGSESYARVVRLIEEIRQVETGFDRAWREGWGWSTDAQPMPVAVRDQLNELSRKHHGINEMLSRYSFSPIIQRVLGERRWMLSMHSSLSADEFALHRVVDEGRKRLSRGEIQLSFHYEHSVSEADVVMRILNLAAATEFDRLKQCDQCFKWLFAERSHQRFCPGAVCRQAKYSKSPKYKNYRKLYMRRQRAEKSAEQSTNPPRKKGK
jgi:hypothetical protein